MVLIAWMVHPAVASRAEERRMATQTQTASIASTGLPAQPYVDEWKRTKPDFLVFHPAPDGKPRWNQEDFCGLNEQLIVVATKRKDLLAFWTSWGPKLRWLRIRTSRSSDGGKTWSTPTTLDGADVDRGRSASWSVPVVTPSGRIYCFYNKYDRRDRGPGWTGRFRCRTSDDDGRTWSDPVDLPFRRTELDPPDPNVPATWIPWKGAAFDRSGRALIAFTRWASPKSQVPNAAVGITSVFCQCELMRLENLREGPKPQDIRVTWLPKGDGIRVPSERHAQASFAQEPSVVCLPNGWLFMAMRTDRGQLWCTVSKDDGATWRGPEPMLYTDGGAPMLHPVSPAPIFRLSDGRFLLLYNNNDGYVFGAKGRWANPNRRPAFLAVGAFQPDARQPIWWSGPKTFIDNDGVAVGAPSMPRLDAAAYPSLTEADGQRVLWYPDRKHFLLGKIVPDARLADMAIRTPPKPVNTRYAREVKRDRPIAYWCFDDPTRASGSTATDQMGKHPGTYRRGVTLVPGAADIGGTAAAFDGTDGYVTTTTLGDFGGALARGATVEFWIRTSTRAPIRQLLGVLNRDGTACVIDLNRDASLAPAVGKTTFFLRAADQACLSGHISTNIYDGRWHHVAWVIHDPSKRRMDVYIDGKPDTTLRLGRQHAPARFSNFHVPFTIGAVNSRGTIARHAAAALDEVALYTAPLSRTRIAAHFRAASRAP